MSQLTRLFFAGLVATALAACSPRTPTGIEGVATGDPSLKAAHGAVPDISGSWVFEERIRVLQPSSLNPVIGAPIVNTPMTQVVCDAEGTIEIVQQGATFHGTATQAVLCRVGDVEFVPPAFAFNPVFDIPSGDIRGRSIHFQTGHTLNQCENRGSLGLERGVAESIHAIGDCPVPFDPGEHHSTWRIRRP